METKDALLLIIDHGSVFWNAWHSSANEELSAAHDRCVRHVRFLREKYPHTHCAIACDSPQSKRKEAHPSYKSQRPEKDKAALEQLRLTKETLVADGLLLWESSGYEADDVIAVAVLRAKQRGMPVLIASADKDLLQLVDDINGIRCVSTKTDVLFTAREVADKFGVPPRQMRDWLVLVGDTSDNIAGVPGVGAKTAAKLLQKYDDLEALFAALERDPASVATPAIVKGLQESREIVRVGVDLVTLRTDAQIVFEELFEERKVQPLRKVDEAEFSDIQEAAHEDAEWPIPEVETQKSEPTPPVDESPKQPPPPVETSKPKENRETALAISTRQFDLSLQPETISGAFKLASGLHNSRLYNRFPSPEAITAVILRGREMGLGALTSLDLFHVVEGKPTPHAHLIISRAKAHPDCEYFQYVGGDATIAKYETKNKRNPKPTPHQYTIEEARKAGLIKSGGNWEKRPAEMLRKTAGVQLARIEYPEAIAGLYAAEELGDEGL
jgi:5'-3' exonuclease